jgi:hypothetical protein
MAKKLTAGDKSLLGVIVLAMANADAPFHMATAAEVKNLLDNDMVEVNNEITEGDKVAVRATEKGQAEAPAPATNEGTNNTVTDTNTATTAAAPAKFGIIANAGAVFAAGRTRKAATMYDFDAMNVGDIIFVPNSEDKPDAAKSLASTISSANKRFSTDTGRTEDVEVKVYQTDDAGKRVKGADGKLVVTGKKTETRPVLEPGKTFAVKPVEGGKTYGSWTAPASGAVILREA